MRLSELGNVLCTRNTSRPLLIDEDVLRGEYIGCHPCINTSSLRLRTEDLLQKIIPAMEHEPIFVKLGTQ